MIIAINYADNNFRKAQKLNTKTAYKKGKVDKVIEYSPVDIDKEFHEENKDILSQKRGGGYWLWKPYFILKTMNNMKDGDYLIYCDSGAAYINKVQYLIDSLNKTNQDIMGFELPLIEKQWTQKSTLLELGCDYDYYKETNQILATYILIKVSDNSKNFMNQYLSNCKKKRLLIDNYDGEDKCFIQHRHDQSIFSLLYKKNKLESFRDPSQYGIRPWEYYNKGRIFRINKKTNSTYPQIIVSFRKASGVMFIIKDKFKYVLTKLRILNEKQFIKKNIIK